MGKGMVEEINRRKIGGKEKERRRKWENTWLRR